MEEFGRGEEVIDSFSGSAEETAVAVRDAAGAERRPLGFGTPGSGCITCKRIK